MTEIDSLKQQIASLDMIRSELDHFFAITPGAIESQQILEQKIMVGDIEFVKQKQLDELNASQGSDFALTSSQIQELQSVLTDLNRYVRNDQAINMSISFLLQIASRLRGLSA